MAMGIEPTCFLAASPSLTPLTTQARHPLYIVIVLMLRACIKIIDSFHFVIACYHLHLLYSSLKMSHFTFIKYFAKNKDLIVRFENAINII